MPQMDFNCEICFHPYDKDYHSPLILPCGHTHCQECLRLLRSPIVCPTCRMPITDDVSRLSKNWALITAMETAHSDLVNLLEQYNLAEGVQMLVGPDEIELASVLSNEGASGTVYRGRFKGREVAVKTYDLHAAIPVLESVKREIAVLLSTTLDCRHIVKCFGITVKDNKFCVIMKLYDRSLTKRITQSAERRLPLPIALRYSLDILRALIELHNLGVVVNDLKPDNVLINDSTDEAVLTDFGISRVVHQTCEGYQGYHTQVVQGTFPYMAPEQFDPSAASGVTTKADIWGFGCTLLHMLTGRMPWDGLGHMGIMREVGGGKRAPDVPQELPPGVQALLHRCFQPSAKQRPSAIELMRDITALTSVAEALSIQGDEPKDSHSLSKVHQYVMAAVGQLKDVVADYSAQLEAVRAENARQSNIISHLTVQVRSLQRIAEQKVSALGGGQQGEAAAPLKQTRQALVHSAHMADAILDLKLGQPDSGDPDLNTQLVQHADGAPTAPTSIRHDTTHLAASASWPLAAAVLLSSTLLKLDIRGASLGDLGARALAEALLHSPPLSRLSLCECGIGPKGGAVIAHALRRNSRLQLLQLDSNEVGDEGLAAFAAMLSTNTTLTLLTLNKNNISDLTTLAGPLRSPTCHLRELGLAQNNLTCWQAVGEALKANSSLHRLHLHYCNLDAQATCFLAAGLKTNMTLRSLNLNFNWFGQVGAAEIADALSVNSGLTELQIAGNLLGDAGAQLVAAALTKNVGLEKLKLDGNMICAKGAAGLAAALTVNKQLTSLSLFDNSIGDEGAVKFGEVVSGRCALKHLMVKHNKVSHTKQQWLRQNTGAGVKVEV